MYFSIIVHKLVVGGQDLLQDLIVVIFMLLHLDQSAEHFVVFVHKVQLHVILDTNRSSLWTCPLFISVIVRHRTVGYCLLLSIIFYI